MVATIRQSRPDDAGAAFAVWEAAVAATHHFLSETDRVEIESLVRTILGETPMWLAVDDDGGIAGFMILDGSHMEALFVDPARHRSGVGRALVEQALRLSAVLTTDVNEQNAGAVAFYERLGFVRKGRSERDGQGRPYPLIHLAYGCAA